MRQLETPRRNKNKFRSAALGIGVRLNNKEMIVTGEVIDIDIDKSMPPAAVVVRVNNREANVCS